MGKPDDKISIACPNCGSSVSGNRIQFDNWKCPKCKIDIELDRDVLRESFVSSAYLLGRTLSFLGWLSVLGGLLFIAFGVYAAKEVRQPIITEMIIVYSFSVGFVGAMIGSIEVYLGRVVKHGGGLFSRVAVDIARLRHKE